MKRGITPLLLESSERAGGRGKGEQIDGFSVDMGAFVFTATYDTAFRICEELGLPLVRSQMKLGHLRGGRWVTTSPEGSLGSFARQIHHQSEYMSFAGDSPLAEINDGEAFGGYLQRLDVPHKLQVTLTGLLKMILGDPRPSQTATAASSARSAIHPFAVALRSRCE